MEEEGTPISGEELNSDLGDLKKEKKQQLKMMILVAFGIGIGLIFLIVLIIALSSQKGGGSDKREEILGEFECIYNVISDTEPTTILGNEFDNSFKFSIIIDNEEIK